MYLFLTLFLNAKEKVFCARIPLSAAAAIVDVVRSGLIASQGSHAAADGADTAPVAATASVVSVPGGTVVTHFCGFGSVPAPSGCWCFGPLRRGVVSFLHARTWASLAALRTVRWRWSAPCSSWGVSTCGAVTVVLVAIQSFLTAQQRSL